MVMHGMEATGSNALNAIENLALSGTVPVEIPEFTRILCLIAEENADSIRRELSSRLEKWKWSRLGIAERSILRLGAAEILYLPDIPPRVTINEYVEMAKSFAGENSPGLVNGILDKVAKAARKPDVQIGRSGKMS
jgi:N utilization substance protein B